MGRSARPAALPATSLWMTAQEVAQYLGVHIQSVYAMRKAGTIPSVPHGTQGMRFPREEILALKFGAPTARDREFEARVRRIVAEMFAPLFAAPADELKPRRRTA